MCTEKTTAELLKEELMINRKHGGFLLEDSEIAKADAFCEGYKAFLDAAKTEREAVNYTVRLAEENGFVPFERGQKIPARR